MKKIIIALSLFFTLLSSINAQKIFIYNADGQKEYFTETDSSRSSRCSVGHLEERLEKLYLQQFTLQKTFVCFG